MMFKLTCLTHSTARRITLRTALLSLALLASAGNVHAASAYNLGVAGNFSAFVFGNMTVTGSTDAAHSIAVQGNFTAGTWTAAQSGSTYSTGGKDWAVVVGGNVNWTNGSVQLIDGKRGQTYVGGTLTVGGANNPTLGVVQQGGASPVDFAATKTLLTSESARLMGMAATGTTLYGTQKSGGWSGGIYLQGSNKAVEYINISSSQLAVGNVFSQLSLDSGFAAGSTIVINITGSVTDIALGNLNSLLGFAGHETILNFGSNVSKLTLGSLNPDVSVLAVNAAITTNCGNDNGTLIGGSYSGCAQLNGGHASSNSSSSTTTVPEPGSLALAALGLLALRTVGRKAKR